MKKGSVGCRAAKNPTWKEYVLVQYDPHWSTHIIVIWCLKWSMSPMQNQHTKKPDTCYTKLQLKPNLNMVKLQAHAKHPKKQV